MDYQHKSRARWMDYAASALEDYLAHEMATFGARGGCQIQRFSRPVRVREQNEKRRNEVRGEFERRTWPLWIGHDEGARLVALEPLAVTSPGTARLSLVDAPVWDWLTELAAAGGLALLYVRSPRPRDYLLTLGADGLCEGRWSRDDEIALEQVEDRRVRPGARWWEVGRERA